MRDIKNVCKWRIYKPNLINFRVKNTLYVEHFLCNVESEKRLQKEMPGKTFIIARIRRIFYGTLNNKLKLQYIDHLISDNNFTTFSNFSGKNK